MTNQLVLTVHVLICVGKIPNALKLSANGKYSIYPLGSFVVVKNNKSGKEGFLDGHSGEVTCVEVSHDGETVASGQCGPPGVKVRYKSILCKVLLLYPPHFSHYSSG